MKDGPYRAMAFDFGLKRIGMAVGQSLLGTAEPLSTLPARDGIPNWDTIGQLLQTWQPDLMVVGLPLHMDKSRSDMTHRAEKFTRRLQGRFHLPCYCWDERLTSVAAEQRLKENTGKNKADLDSVAAQIILESWFSNYSQPPAKAL